MTKKKTRGRVDQQRPAHRTQGTLPSDAPVIDLFTLCAKWEREPFCRRLQRCRAVLAIHGYLTDRENTRIRNRMDRAYDAAHRARFGESYPDGD